MADPAEIDLPPRLAAPPRRALAAAGIFRLEQLAGMRESELRGLHGMGPKAVEQLRAALEERGLSFADGCPADGCSADDVREALRPIASLMSKSEKAQQKLRPGTWQHTMLRDNLKALHLAFALMGEEPRDAVEVAPGELDEALRAIASMASRTEEAQAKFSPGTSQHTLQRNRLKALRVAEALLRERAGTDAQGVG